MIPEILLEGPHRLLSYIQRPIIVGRIHNLAEQLRVHQKLAGIEHFPPVRVPPVRNPTIEAVSHVGFPQWHTWPVIGQIILASLSPFSLSFGESGNVLIIRPLEVPSVVVESFGVTLRAVTLKGVWSDGSGVLSRLDGIQNIRLPAASLTCEIRPARDSSFLRFDLRAIRQCQLTGQALPANLHERKILKALLEPPSRRVRRRPGPAAIFVAFLICARGSLEPIRMNQQIHLHRTTLDAEVLLLHVGSTLSSNMLIQRLFGLCAGECPTLWTAHGRFVVDQLQELVRPHGRVGLVALVVVLQ